MTTACTTGKTCYPSAQEAWRIANHVKRRRTRELRTTPSYVYRCDECHTWHLSSKATMQRDK